MATGQERLAQLTARTSPVQEKVAATPASEIEFDTVGVVQLAGLLDKVAEANPKLGALLEKSAQALRVTVKQRDYLIDELAERMQEKSASAFAKELVDRGIWTREELESKTAELMKIPNLGAVKQAVELLPRPAKAPSIGEVDKEAQAAHSGMDKKYAEDPAVQFLMEHAA